MNDRARWSLPNLLSAMRLGLVPLLLLLALSGRRDAFLWLLAVAFLTDAVDGTIARLTGQVTRFGAVLDSWADVSIYAAVAVSMALLWPDLLKSEAPAIGAMVASFLLPAAVGLLRFGRFTSYHTWLVKVAVAAAAVGLFLMLLGISVWPFRIAAVLVLLAGLEEIAISLVLREERSDVSGLWAVLRERRRMRGGGP
ncbi:MAG: CDP-alcohol phosphatidyltransferase family protein [Thiohalocapsa sp.]|jgi:CDP-diacylglycerol--glycerol-3-phosphate 3-phosphatidyltransferase|uniref:CDP-alcohol phosphatidyltransferase family protein n=1 Tax=Thiohalocapsa sp. TaxID=2497641 RepID=UPI0025CCD52C|nr:CDP-alcohol phosphatidyltransferase family protein [Thiohalocapsa sp.]MCG6941373.1 CDP-alcohol phosphatidyltransferase family protein [Thiohalocapsa sp.]